MKKIIDLTRNGLPGFAVIVPNEDQFHADFEQFKAMFSKKKLFCRKASKMLKAQSRKHVHTIKAGETFDDGYEIMDKDKFDRDLVCIAMYDAIGNNKPIELLEVA